jgi:hypothetical protein
LADDTLRDFAIIGGNNSTLKYRNIHEQTGTGLPVS